MRTLLTTAAVVLGLTLGLPAPASAWPTRLPIPAPPGTVARSVLPPPLPSWVHVYADVPGKYARSNVSYVHGELRLHLTGTTGFGLYVYEPFLYGRVEATVQVTGAGGNGASVMLWPADHPGCPGGCWGEGEMDFPEGNFDGRIHVFHHEVGCKRCTDADGLDTRATWRHPHRVAIDWRADAVRYYLDGTLVKTVTHDIPTTKHRFTLQADNTRWRAKAGDLVVTKIKITP